MPWIFPWIKPNIEMARKLFIAAGHSNVKGGDLGASANGYTEGLLTIELRDLIVSELKAIGVNPTIDANSNALAQSIQYFKAFTNPDALLIDIHFNAGTSAASGVEVIVPDDANAYEKSVAQQILTATTKTLGLLSRGLLKESQTPRKKLGWMRLIGNNVLIETCFISNVKDMISYNAHKKELAKSIATVIKNNL